MENQPALIVGILPGVSKSETEGYVKSNAIQIPMYLDADRSFEKALLAMGLLPKEISLSNTVQCVVADGEGALRYGRWNDPAGSLQPALATAKWKTDPAGVPPALKPAWRALEFGQVAIAAPAIQQALKSSDPKVKEGAQALEKSVKDEIEARTAEAKAKADAGEKWAAFKLYESVATDFKAFPGSRAAATELGKLRSEKAVSRELQARAALEAVVRDYLNTSSKAKQAQGRQMLQQIAQKFADTEAGATAKTIQ
jgi:hypothetical protein